MGHPPFFVLFMPHQTSHRLHLFLRSFRICAEYDKVELNFSLRSTKNSSANRKLFARKPYLGMLKTSYFDRFQTFKIMFLNKSMIFVMNFCSNFIETVFVNDFAF